MPQLTYRNISPRTGQALVCAAMGMTAKATAKAMGCQVSTVDSLRSNAMYKLHASNMVQAVSEAYRRGVLTYVAILLCFITAGGSSIHQRPARSPIRPVVALRVIGREVV